MQIVKRQKWINAIETHQEFDYTVSRFFVCESHFTTGSIQRRGKNTSLDANAVPSIFPDYQIEYLNEDEIYLEDYLSS